MNDQLQLDERRATAPPHWWVTDFDKPDGYELSPCEKCLRTFRGCAFRQLCRDCSWPS